MNIQNIADLIVAVAIALISAVGSLVANSVKKDKQKQAALNQAQVLLNVTKPLASAAVVAAQKLGVTQYVSGEIQKSHAVQSVLLDLAKLGFKAVDSSMIEKAVEKAYSDAKSELANNYPQMTQAQQEVLDQQAADKQAADQQAADEKVKADAITAAQQAVTDAQAHLQELRAK